MWNPHASMRPFRVGPYRVGWPSRYFEIPFEPFELFEFFELFELPFEPFELFELPFELFELPFELTRFGL